MSVALPSSAPRASQSASGSVYLVPSFANSAGGSWRTRSTSARMASCVSVGVPGGNSIGGAFDVSASSFTVNVMLSVGPRQKENRAKDLEGVVFMHDSTVVTAKPPCADEAV